MKRPTPLVAATLLALLLAGCGEKKAPPRPSWDAEVVDRFAKLAVQDRGRVKPLDTFAGFTLLKINGKRSVTTPWGETLGPTAWLLDTLFYPELARTYDCLRVQNDEALDAIGLAHDAKRKRDWYSFADFDSEKAREQLQEQARNYSMNIKESDQTPAQSQVVQLYHNVAELDGLLRALDFARHPYVKTRAGALAKLFPDAKDDRLSTILARAKEVLDAYRSAPEGPELAAFQEMLDGVETFGSSERVLALFPGSSPDDKEWMTVSRRRAPEDFPDPDGLLERAFKTDEPLGAQIGLLAALEDCERTKGDRPAFLANTARFADGNVKLAEARGEYSKVPLEVAFYKIGFFWWALYIFTLSFVLVAFSWLFPGRLLVRASQAALGIAAAFLVTGIVFRCIIRGRPPVSTLYETILFITACAVLVCGAIEWLNRQRIASAVASVLGTAGMFLAAKYEFSNEVANAGDTMTSLLAVLDTNFWLATHVTSVTLGYSAGLLASAIAHVWIAGKVLGIRKDDAVFYKNVSRMVYGVLCFGLLFSTVGTILGGIWANYSWGRFWGWDPKENGALMIVLWELAILHARMGGYIRDLGLAVTAVLGGGVVAFSWWGVNLLGVGLHSYGFTNGAVQGLAVFYGLETLVLLVAAGWWLAQRSAAPAQEMPAPEAAAKS